MKNQVELTKNAYKEKTEFRITKYLLIIKEYNSINTSKDELIKIFTQSGINIVFTNEILDNLPSKMTTTPEEEISDNSIIQTTPQPEREEENKLLREKLLHAEEKIKQLEEEILSLKTQKQSKSIKDYFEKK
jgi:SAM-dependent MidA family methyltransferase